MLIPNFIMVLLSNKKNSRGFTIVEMEVGIAVFMIIFLAVSSFIIYMYRSQRYNFEQLGAVNSARRALELTSEEIRKMDDAETGPYAIAAADSQTFIFYSDVDGDNQTEKVRYFYDSGAKEFKKGVTESTGNYAGAEIVSVVISNVINGANPLFLYYDEDFTGTEAPLATPADVTQVKLIKVALSIDQNENTMPPAFNIETNVQPRNLKEN